MTIADRIRECRERKGMSQDELAKRMGLKSRSSITRIEKAGDDVSMKDIERIAEALDCSKLYLWGIEYDIMLNDEELTLILNYRKGTPEEKKVILACAKTFAQAKEEINEE